MKPFVMMARKLANGINHQYGTHLVINVNEFYGDGGNLVRMYEVKDSFYSPTKGSVNKSLFKSASGVYTVLFMRDLMLKIQGQDLPPDEEDPGWAATREKKGAIQAFDYVLENYVYDVVEVDDDE